MANSFAFCPRCSREIECPAENEGKHIPCPACGHEIVPTQPSPDTPKKIGSGLGYFQWECPHCHSRITCSKTLQGFTIECPSCKKELDLTDPGNPVKFKHNYPTPFLTSIFRIEGGVALVISLACLIFSIYCLFQEKFSFMALFSSWSLYGLIGCFGFAVAAILAFGIGQIIQYVGNICRNTERLVVMELDRKQ